MCKTDYLKFAKTYFREFRERLPFKKFRENKFFKFAKFAKISFRENFCRENLYTRTFLPLRWKKINKIRKKNIKIIRNIQTKTSEKTFEKIRKKNLVHYRVFFYCFGPSISHNLLNFIHFTNPFQESY